VIYSFVPSQGPFSGLTYFFPNVSEDTRSNQRNNTLQNIAMADGQVDASGTQRMPYISGVLTLTFKMSPIWYKNNLNDIDYYNGTGNDFVARENALLHFMLAVVEGGNGTLKDLLWSGVSDLSDNSSLSFYHAAAKVSGDVSPNRKQTLVELAATFAILGGHWIGSNGRKYPFF
jgi:hypothetical protein